MPGTLAELYGALLKQEPQGILSAARFNPLMMAKALRQQEAYPRPSLASLMNYPQTWQQFGDNIQANYPTDSPAAVRQAAFEAAKNAGPLMTVWHASPHKFDKFDASKIGSGQGAQSYGHGIYAAENPKLSGPAGSYDVEFTAKNLGKYDLNQAEESVLRSIRAGKSDMDIVGELAQSGAAGTFDEAMGLLNRVKASKANIYKVDLPDDQIAKMLDWDKPLSQQPEAVRDGFLRAMELHMGRRPSVNMDTFTGAQAYDMLSGGARGMQGYENLSAQASKALRKAGIPGIRYLDQGSRGAGSGTSNFVVFPGNEGALKILARE